MTLRHLDADAGLEVLDPLLLFGALVRVVLTKSLARNLLGDPSALV